MLETFKINFNLYLSYLLAILVMCSCMPFFLIGGISTLINFSVFLVYSIFYFLYLQQSKFIINVDTKSLWITLLLFIYLYFPFRSYDQLVASTIWPIVFLSVLTLDKIIVSRSISIFSNAVFYVASGALLVYALLLLGVPLPSFDYSTGLSGTIKSTYTVYPGTAKLTGQDYNILGRNVFRLSGIFAEPGHFGVVCAIVLFFKPVFISSFKRLIIVIAAVLTFSMGTFILLIGLALLRVRLSKFRATFAIIGIVILIAGVGFLPEQIYERFISSKLTGDATTILNDRTTQEFSLFYEHFNRNDVNLFGEGRLVLEKNFLTNSDYRGFLLKFGFVGALLLFIWFFKIHGVRRQKEILLTLFLFIVIFVHRAWLIDYLVFYFAIYTIPSTYDSLNWRSKFSNV